MAILYKFRCISRKSIYSLELSFKKDSNLKTPAFGSFCTDVKKPKFQSFFKVSVVGVGIGIVLGVGYAFKQINFAQQKKILEGTQIKNESLTDLPNTKISRKVTSHSDTTGLTLTLYQYQTCPFCCKVRVLLDYYGLSYDVVEVDPVLKKELSWSSYRKVPILLAKVENGYQPLYDSSMIVSVLSSFLYDQSEGLEQLSKYYPMIAIHDERGNFKHEIVNKYFLMYQNTLPKDKQLNDIVEERKWRKWVDDSLVHTLSPNVYRTLRESLQTFKWFSEIGHWNEYFPTWEKLIMIYLGAIAMFLVSKRLKKRHNLKDNVRESFYDAINIWLTAIQVKNNKFMGGVNPDLSDLAVYGVLSSIEGCEAFNDALKFTELGTWYNAMKKKVESHAGNTLLNVK